VYLCGSQIPRAIPMNKQNVLKAITIMERAKAHGSVCMTDWQSGGVMDTQQTEQGLHACGNTACFAGHIAISPEWKIDGGIIGRFGEPSMNGSSPTKCIAEWLDVDRRIATSLIYGDLCAASKESSFYGKPWADVNADDVLNKLQMILTGDLS
jgi:hypothetical protein